MSIPTTIESLSTTAASNGPAGSEDRSIADDGLRQAYAFTRQLVTLGSNIASASSITPPSTGSVFNITGVVTITAIASTNSWDGRVVTFIFAAALTLTHGANLALPGSVNITTAANDVATFVQTASGAWRLRTYTYAAGGYLPLSGGTMTGAVSGITNLTTTGNTILGNAQGDTLNVAAGAIAVGAAGNVTIAAPTSGAALSVNGFAGSNVANFLMTGADANALVQSTTSGDAFLTLTTVGVQTYSIKSLRSTAGLSIQQNGTEVIGIGPNRNVTIAAPSSGVALTVAAVSGTHSTKIADSANTSYNAGFLELPVNGQATPYTAVLADAGKCLYYSAAGAATFTIPANGSVAYAIGTTLTFVNDASGATNMTIAITTDTLVLSPGGTTGSRTLAQYGRATAHKVTATRWIISGSGLT
jgi:hypothetical protein